MLRVALSDHVIGDQQVRLRSYNGQVTGPTLRFKPGESVRILLANELARNPDPMPSNHNIPHHFNTTNLHTHGLHISPSNSSDNVLLKIEPGERFQYRFDIPDDQPGTFWYHAHVHGSSFSDHGPVSAPGVVFSGTSPIRYRRRPNTCSTSFVPSSKPTTASRPMSTSTQPMC
jgi:FtsP/CotA-like multicopper oxidase with cupredoxin domain